MPARIETHPLRTSVGDFARGLQELKRDYIDLEKQQCSGAS